MSAWNIPLALALIAAVGCAPKNRRTPGTDPVSSPPAPVEAPQAAPAGTCALAKLASCEAELEAVASCFHACVTEAQKEPGEEPLASFIAEHGTGEACEAVQIEKDCEKLVLSGGGEVTHEHQMASHDNFDDHDVMHIVYTFSSQSCDAKARSKIELHVGQ